MGCYESWSPQGTVPGRTDGGEGLSLTPCRVSGLCDTLTELLVKLLPTSSWDSDQVLFETLSLSSLKHLVEPFRLGNVWAPSGSSQ